MGASAKKWTQEEFNLVSEHILARSEKQVEVELELAAIKLEIGNYLLNETPDAKISAGDFLKRFIKATGKKNKIFASYVGMEASNLSSIFSGRRKINLNFALKLEQIFGVPANWWFETQLKNEFLNIEKKKKVNGKKYSLKGLLKKVG